MFGITVCSNYTDDSAISTIVEKQWNVSRGSTSYAYYEEFVRTIATTTYSSLSNFERYATDESVQSIDMIDVVRTVRREYLKGLDRNTYSPIITEFGVCYTNGYFRNNLRRNPRFADEVMEKYHSATRYTHSDQMEMSILPYFFDKNTNFTIVSS